MHSGPASSVWGLSMGGYIAEVFRAGFQAIHSGQREAALAVGMTPLKSFRYIMLPLAVRIVLPPMLNMLILLLKDSSLCALITTPELLLTAKDLASMSFLPMHLYLLVGVVYLALSLPMSVYCTIGRGKNVARYAKCINLKVRIVDQSRLLNR